MKSILIWRKEVEQTYKTKVGWTGALRLSVKLNLPLRKRETLSWNFFLLTMCFEAILHVYYFYIHILCLDVIYIYLYLFHLSFVFTFFLFYLSVSGCVSHFLKQVIIIVQLDSRVWNQLLRMFTTCPWLVGSLQWRKSLEIVPSGNKACTGLFLYPLNTSAKPNVFRDFQGVQIGTVA